MSSTANLDNLVKVGLLKAESPTEDELAGLRASGIERLRDAETASLSFSSRFDLAYNAGHALALLALRRCGYRSANRAVVFQSLEHTAGMPAEKWRVFTKAHQSRNVSEYEGHMDPDERLLAQLIALTKELRDTVCA